LGKSPVSGSTPHKVSDETEKKVLELSVEHPAWGQQRISDELMLKLYNTKLAIIAADLIYDRVLPFYEAEGLKIEAVLTDNGKEFKDKPYEHPYELLLSLNDIEHRLTKISSPGTNGFVERFNRTILNEFFREAFRKKFYGEVAELQKDMDRWLERYSRERPHRGYRNQGRKPYETLTQGKKEVGKVKAKRKDTKEMKEATWVTRKDPAGRGLLSGKRLTLHIMLPGKDTNFSRDRKVLVPFAKET